MENKSEIIIKSGNGNKSIGNYIDKICKELIEKLNITIIAYDNNMNKLITIEQIIKRSLYKDEIKDNFDTNNHSKINYEIGKNNNIPYIKCTIKINKDDINNLQKLIGNKNKKRNSKINFFKNKKNDEMDVEDDFDDNKNKKQKIGNKEKEEDKDMINNLCIQNIEEFFK